MTVYLSPSPKFQVLDFSGSSAHPMSGGKLHTYLAGTTLPLGTYQDAAGSTLNSNPIILDSRGEADIRLKTGYNYKFLLTDADDNFIWSVDNIASLDALIEAFAADLANSSDPTKGAALVGYIGGSVYSRLNQLILDSRNYDSLQSAINALPSQGGTILVDGGYSDLTDVITITKDNVTLMSTNKAWLRWDSLGAGIATQYGNMTAGILVSANNFKMVNIGLEGPQSQAGHYVGNACLIELRGTSGTQRLSGFIMEDCEITQVGSYGVFCQYVDNIRISRCYAHYIGHAAFLFNSCAWGLFEGNTVSDITPGTAGNMYGITISMYAPTGWEDLSGNWEPTCDHWVIDNNYMHDINWEGIDAHGSKNLLITRNRIYATKQGIGVSTNSNLGARYGGWNVIVDNNVVDARNPDLSASGYENQQYGINVNGGLDRRAVNIKVTNNIVLYKGILNNTVPSGGAIQCAYINDLVVANNTIDFWNGAAIGWDYSSYVVFANNIIGKLATAPDGAGYGFNATTSESDTVTVIGNIFTAKDGTAGRVAWNQQNAAQRPLMMGNNFAAATSQEIRLSANNFVSGSQWGQVVTNSTGNATPTIAGCTEGIPVILEVYTASGAVTMTNILGAVTGQMVILRCIGSNSLTFTRANAKLLAGSDWTGTGNEALTLIKDPYGAWCEVHRSGAIS